MARHIDWASTGANGGIWWEEFSRTTLSGTADSISVTPIATRKYLMILATTLNSGSIGQTIQFNGDSAANYAARNSRNGAAESTATSTSTIFLAGNASSNLYSVTYVINVAAQEKQFYTSASEVGTAGAANLPVRQETSGKWANTSNAITRVDIINTSTGDYLSGSEVIVLGHN